jgi:hypothetical protein
MNENKLELEKKKLEKQLKDINLKIEMKKEKIKENVPVKEMKMFITYKGKFIFKKIDQILFDTMGIYSHLVEAKQDYKWKFEYFPTLLFGRMTNDTDRFEFEFYKNIKIEMKISGLDIVESVGRVLKNDKIIIDIMKTKNKAYFIQYNSNILNTDNVIAIMDKMFKFYNDNKNSLFYIENKINWYRKW